MSKQPKCFADTLPVHFRRACSAASADGGLRAWLDTKFGEGKWILGEYPRDGAEIALTSHAYADLAVEYGYQRLAAIFASLDPVAAASAISSTDWEDVEQLTNVIPWCDACQSNHWAGQCDPDLDEQRMPR